MCLTHTEGNRFAEGGGLYAVEGLGRGGPAAHFSKADQMEGEQGCQTVNTPISDMNSL